MRTLLLVSLLGLGAAFASCETSQNNQMAPSASETPDGLIVANYAYLTEDP